MGQKAGTPVEKGAYQKGHCKNNGPLRSNKMALQALTTSMSHCDEDEVEVGQRTRCSQTRLCHV